MSVGSSPQSRGHSDGQPSAAESGPSRVMDRRATCRPAARAVAGTAVGGLAGAGVAGSGWAVPGRGGPARPCRAGPGPRRQASCAALLPVPPGSGLAGRGVPLGVRLPGPSSDLPTRCPGPGRYGGWRSGRCGRGPFWVRRAREGGARSPLSGAARRFDAAGVGAVRSAPSMGPVVPVRRMAGTGSVWAWTAGRPRSVGWAGRPGRAGPGLDLGAVGRSGAAGGWSRPVAATRPCRAQVAVPRPGGPAAPGGGSHSASPGGRSRPVGGVGWRGRGG